MLRKIIAVHEAQREDIGSLITFRAMPTAKVKMGRLDPFLFLNHHGPQVYPPHNEGLPFGPHPHRGFQTVTFILDGALLHQDSGGYRSVIGPGGVQWMKAGSGLIHAELSPEEFLEKGGPLEILQLWVNLPARLKMSQPRYAGLQREQIPALIQNDDRVTVNLVSGELNGVRGPFEADTDIHLSWIQFRSGGSHARTVTPDRTIFLYVVRGELMVNGAKLKARQIVLFSDEGETLEMEAETDSVLLFGHAAPYQEEMAAYGPFVMNTQDEIVQAIRDYQSGKFGTWE